MQKVAIEKFCNKIFWWFVSIHAILWIILPTCLRYALPHDTIEGALWGQHLEWGYDKNPWMNAWLTRLGFEIGGTSGIGIYLLSEIFIIVCFWSVWKLARKILTPVYALVSVLLLEGCINYTLVPQSFNDNLIELSLWPLLFYCFYYAVTKQKTRDWITVGIIAGLSMMAKYFSIIPLVTMFGFLVFNKKARESFSQPGIYLAAVSSLLIMLPHIIWLFENQFITITYAFVRTTNETTTWWRTHLVYPAQFGFAQFINFLPALLLFPLLYSRRAALITQPIIASRQSLTRFDKQFILTMGLGPYLLVLLLSIIIGWRLYNEWGVPLLSLWGVLLVAYTQPKITFKALKRFIIGTFVIMFLWGAGYVGGLFISKADKHSDNYPAQAIADSITQQWHEQYHKPLKYVAGSRYIGGYLSFYSKDHPSILVEWDPQLSPWINITKMKKYGAVFIQDNYYGTTVFGDKPYTNDGNEFPPEVLKLYPNLQVMPVQYFPWHRAKPNVQPVKVLIGFLPPEG